MTEAVAASFIDFCFENFPLRRVSAEVFANNPASARVLEKAGFVFEGGLTNNVIKDGKLLDSLLYAKNEVETRRRCVRAEWRHLYLAV